MERWVSGLGLVTMIGLAWLMSSHKRRVDWRLVGLGVALQVAFAFLILRTDPGRAVFDKIGDFVTTFLGFVDAGSGFVFGIDGDPAEGFPPRGSLLKTFAFGVLPTIIFFASFMSILYHIGVMQWVVRGMAWVMQKTLRTSGAESLAAAANVFVGHTEAPLVIKPFLPRLTMSELNALMVGGFSTITGGLLAVYAGMGIDPGHLVTASVISAPASLVIAKILQPETTRPDTYGVVAVDTEKRGVNVIEAAAIGASDGLKLALNVGAMLIAFLGLIAMVNAGVGWVGEWFDQAWTLEAGLGALFAPLAWLMGIEWSEAPRAGQLLGMKIVANEFIAYDMLGKAMAPDAESPLSDRSVLILTYALSGFSNFGAIGIQIAGIGGLAPERRSDISRLGLRAMVGGTFACGMTACIAGLLLA